VSLLKRYHSRGSRIGRRGRTASRLYVLPCCSFTSGLSFRPTEVPEINEGFNGIYRGRCPYRLSECSGGLIKGYCGTFPFATALFRVIGRFGGCREVSSLFSSLKAGGKLAQSLEPPESTDKEKRPSAYALDLSLRRRLPRDETPFTANPTTPLLVWKGVLWISIFIWIIGICRYSDYTPTRQPLVLNCWG